MTSLTGFAFGSLGLLIGIITGMTEASVTQALIGFLFAFAGGSAIAFRNKLQPNDRRVAEASILVLSFGCIIGIGVGIIVSEWRMLSPEFWKSSTRIAREAEPATAADRQVQEQRDEMREEIQKHLSDLWPDDLGPTTSQERLAGSRKYLRSAELKGEIDRIEALVDKGVYDYEKAYQELRDWIRKEASDEGSE